MSISHGYFDIPIEHRSVYYANSLCDALEKPKNLLFKGVDTDCLVIDLIASVALAILLAIPAALGYCLSKVIYGITGEKIKDYKAQLDDWQEKIYNPHGNGLELEAVLDGLIRYRIKASQCPFDTIQTLDISSGRSVHCIFQFEGPLHSIDTLAPTRKKFLILMAPAGYKGAKFISDRIRSKFPIPTDEEIRQYYKQNDSDGVDGKNADKCSFVWIPPRSITSITHQRTVDSSTINLIKNLFENKKELPNEKVASF